jgi:chaperonin GroES
VPIHTDITDAKTRLEAYTEATNLVTELDQSQQAALSSRVLDEYEIDENSRKDWLADYDEYMAIVNMVSNGESGKADIQYPLIATAAIQFAARALAAIVQGRNVVKGKVIGKDVDGSKAARADRIGTHMSYQCLEEMPEWMDDMDRLLTIIAVTGCEFKKSWYDNITGTNVSEFVSAKKVVVNQSAKSLEKAPRITHIIELYPHEIEERIRAERFADFDYKGQTGSEPNDEDSPHVFLEQHRRWDIDDDKYPEPVIVTIHKDTGTIVRISARFDKKGVYVDDRNRVVMIEPVMYFTKFPFLRSFDGSFYDIGFGKLLSQNNRIVNSSINQLLDSATDQNTGGGFIAGDIGLKGSKAGGEIKFRRNEYKQINITGDDIRKRIFPRPVSQPSPVSFSLLELLITASEKLASVSEIMTGTPPPANTPATTTLSMVEQGMKLFGAIYGRIHRALGSEFKKLFRLNRLYMSGEKYFRVMDDEKSISQEDYNADDCDVTPASDPDNITDVQKLLKAEALMKLSGTGLKDDVIKRRYLEALNIPDIEELMPDPEAAAQPPAEVQLELAKQELEKAKIDIEKERLEIDKEKAGYEILKLRADTMLSLAEAEAKEVGSQLDEYRAKMEGMEAQVRMLQEGEEKPKGTKNADIKNGMGGMGDTSGNAKVPGGSATPEGAGEEPAGVGANSQ